MAGVFISYRRADSGGWAGRLFDHLSLRFGKDLVFQDLDDIEPGENFLKVILEAIDACDVFLAIIGPLWLVNAQGEKRLDNPDDVLLMEIQEALKLERNIIPVLVGDADIPSAGDLPESISTIAHLNAVELSGNRWTYDVSLLVDRIRELLLPTRKQFTLSETKAELQRMERRYFDLLETDAAGALEITQQVQALLDRVSPIYPHDPYLQLVRGYFFKNEAMAFLRLGRYAEYTTSLEAADRIFQTMINERPNDAGAWNGRGSVEIIRGNYQAALGYIDRALEINPGYEAAFHDRKMVLERLRG